jgi:hypothetical protein
MGRASPAIGENVAGQVLVLSGLQFAQHQPPKPYGFREQLRLSDRRDACFVLTCESRLDNFCCSHWSQCDPRGTAQLSCISHKMLRYSPTAILRSAVQ